MLNNLMNNLFININILILIIYRKKTIKIFILFFINLNLIIYIKIFI